MGFIYCVTFPSGKRYVGQTTQSIEVRIGQHKKSKNSQLICRAFKKYSSYKVETLLEINNELLDMYEIKFIEMLNTLNPSGYNLSTGGGSGRKHSTYSREKMSKSHIGVPLSDHHKQRLSESHIGRIVTEETRAKISQSNSGKPRTDEFRQHMSNKSRKVKCDLPMYVYKIRNGYKIRPPNDIEKVFASTKFTDEEKLKLALEYLESKTKVSND
jgi:hypothetical protein